MAEMLSTCHANYHSKLSKTFFWEDPTMSISTFGIYPILKYKNENKAMSEIKKDICFGQYFNALKDNAVCRMKSNRLVGRPWDYPENFGI